MLDGLLNRSLRLILTSKLGRHMTGRLNRKLSRRQVLSLGESLRGGPGGSWRRRWSESRIRSSLGCRSNCALRGRPRRMLRRNPSRSRSRRGCRGKSWRLSTSLARSHSLSGCRNRRRRWSGTRCMSRKHRWDFGNRWDIRDRNRRDLVRHNRGLFLNKIRGSLLHRMS